MIEIETAVLARPTEVMGMMVTASVMGTMAVTLTAGVLASAGVTMIEKVMGLLKGWGTVGVMLLLD